MIPDELKTLIDIGLGGVSLMLWLRQGKVNKAQVALDQAQSKATQDLTTMVKDHEGRLVKLERRRVSQRRKVKK